MKTFIVCLIIACYLQLFAADFGGVYQIETIPNNTTCLYPHDTTKKCECPDGFVPNCVYGILNNNLISSNTCFCEPKVQAKGDAYGGLFAQQVRDCDGAPCIAANRYSGQCSCPKGYNNITIGLVNVGAGCQDAFDALIYVCLNNVDDSNFLGGYEVTPFGEVCMYPNALVSPPSCSCPHGSVAWTGRGTCDGTSYSCFANETYFDPFLVVCWDPSPILL